MKSSLAILLIHVLVAPWVFGIEENKGPEPSIKLGSEVFSARCVLCHGPSGMGEGLIPLKIKDYPKTNLVKNIKAKSRQQIHNAVVFGGCMGELSKYMPPMGNELTWTEIESVVSFIELLRKNSQQAIALLEASNIHQKPSRKLGQKLFESRCVLCHGNFGEGNGRMAKIVKAPKPANLVKSRLPDDYLTQIIRKGGEGVNRSPQMPPWGMQFNEVELASIVLYVKSIRE